MCMPSAILNLSRALSLCISVSVSLSLHPATHAASFCITLQHTATGCNTLQQVAIQCNTMQHNATQCNTMPRIGCVLPISCCSRLRTGAPHTMQQICNTLQHIATYCNTLQHTATHCNTLQHTAPQRHHYLDRLRALTLAHPGQSMFIYLWSHSTQNSLVLELYHQHHNYAQSRQILFEVLFFLTRSHASLHLNDIFKRHV